MQGGTSLRGFRWTICLVCVAIALAMGYQSISPMEVEEGTDDVASEKRKAHWGIKHLYFGGI